MAKTIKTNTDEVGQVLAEQFAERNATGTFEVSRQGEPSPGETVFDVTLTLDDTPEE